MAEKKIKVKVGDKIGFVPVKTSIQKTMEILGQENKGMVAAIIDNVLVGLQTQLYTGNEVKPVYRDENIGISVVRESVSHIFHSLMRERHPELSFFVGQSLHGGYFYEVYDGDTEPDLFALAEEMTDAIEELAKAKESFHRHIVTINHALDSLPKEFKAKRKLLQAWPGGLISMIGLRGFDDIQHSPYALDTSCALGTKVVPYPPGLILQFPGASEKGTADRGKKLWEVYRETRDWNRKISVATVGDLNKAVLEGRESDVIQIAEAQHEKKMAQIADLIIQKQKQKQARIVCVAGPSSAGKSTFVQRLSIQLRVGGVEPILMNLDDYYRPRCEYPLDENGEADFEALEALNLEKIQEDVKNLLVGKEILIPKFNFKEGLPEPKNMWRSVSLGKEQVLIIEGIHGLNPALLGDCPDNEVIRIFINALTQLMIDEHNRIATMVIRLIRRIVRDRRYRGTLAQETIDRWPSVIRGESRHIYPFQEKADIMFNSTLSYEVAVLKTFAWRYLMEVPRDNPARVNANRLLGFLDLFIPVFPDAVPENSVLREFIGGSRFSY